MCGSRRARARTGSASETNTSFSVARAPVRPTTNTLTQVETKQTHFLLVGSDSGSRYSNEGIRGTDRISIMMLGKATARSQISSLIEEVPLKSHRSCSVGLILGIPP